MRKLSSFCAHAGNDSQRVGVCILNAETDSSTKFWVVKRFRLQEWLVTRGFQPIKQQPDRNNPRYSVWVYRKTPELMASITAYYSQSCFGSESI